MCDIARTVPGVLGERMLGGGDKGAAGALVRADSVDALEAAVRSGYPRSHPAYADAFAVHVCRVVEGMTALEEPI
jgi:galactokinase